jgi:hypothetical protein
MVSDKILSIDQYGFYGEGRHCEPMNMCGSQRILRRLALRTLLRSLPVANPTVR